MITIWFTICFLNISKDYEKQCGGDMEEVPWMGSWHSEWNWLVIFSKFLWYNIGLLLLCWLFINRMNLGYTRRLMLWEGWYREFALIHSTGVLYFKANSCVSLLLSCWKIENCFLYYGIISYVLMLLSK